MTDFMWKGSETKPGALGEDGVGSSRRDRARVIRTGRARSGCRSPGEESIAGFLIPLIHTGDRDDPCVSTVGIVNSCISIISPLPAWTVPISW